MVCAAADRVTPWAGELQAVVGAVKGPGTTWQGALMGPCGSWRRPLWRAPLHALSQSLPPSTSILPSAGWGQHLGGRWGPWRIPHSFSKRSQLSAPSRVWRGLGERSRDLSLTLQGRWMQQSHVTASIGGQWRGPQSGPVGPISVTVLTVSVCQAAEGELISRSASCCLGSWDGCALVTCAPLLPMLVLVAGQGHTLRIWVLASVGVGRGSSPEDTDFRLQVLGPWGPWPAGLFLPLFS